MRTWYRVVGPPRTYTSDVAERPKGVLACQMSSHQRHVDGDVRIGRKASRKRRFDAKMCEPGFALRVASEQAKRARDELDAREVRLEKEQCEARHRFVQGGQALLSAHHENQVRQRTLDSMIGDADRYLQETSMRAAQEDAARIHAQQEAIDKAASADVRAINVREHARCMEAFHRRHRVTMAQHEVNALAWRAKERADACANASRRIAHAAVAAVLYRTRTTSTLHKAAYARLGFAYRAGRTATRET